MLRTVSMGVLTLWFNLTSNVYTLHESQLSDWVQESAWVESLLKPEYKPNPTAEALMQSYLGRLERLGFSASEQGFWVQSGRDVLAFHQSTEPLPAASLTKIATTLVALETWSPDHTFETQISATGHLQDDTLTGDLVIQGGGDPFFVWEEAIALGNALNQMGIRRVTGDVIVAGNFAMNYESNPLRSGELFIQGINANLWPYEADYQFRTLPPETPRPEVEVMGRVRMLPTSALEEPLYPLIRHESLPLDQILKSMNVYSNNAMAEMLAEELGGARVVAKKAAAAAYVPEDEIVLENGSGLGVENRISPRAVTAMMMAIQRHLAARDLNVADLFPVMGRDEGTLLDRRMPESATVKTGTLNDVSALAGVIPTRDRGLVWFTIINRGWDLDEFRYQQDLFLQGLSQEWTPTASVPDEIRSSDRDQMSANKLGAPERNTILVQPSETASVPKDLPE